MLAQFDSYFEHCFIPYSHYSVLINKIKGVLKRTSDLIRGISSNFIESSTKIKEEILQDLEDVLVMNDVGYKTTKKIIEKILEIPNYEISEDSLKKAIYNVIISIFSENSIQEQTKNCENINIKNNNNLPYVFILCGVNGVGKTTTIAKLVYYFQKQNYKVAIGACDTFRAAATEQIEAWGRYTDCMVITGNNSDPASIVYKSYYTAKESGHDILIIDTAGRLHNNVDMMNELQKCVNVLKKINSTLPNQISLVIDGTAGQNSVLQVEQFKKIIKIDSIIVTKLDSGAKAGTLVNIADTHAIPISFIGVGEKIDDLKLFDHISFTKSLLEINDIGNDTNNDIASYSTK